MNQSDFTTTIITIRDSWLVKGILSSISTIWIALFGAWTVPFTSLVILLILDLVAKLTKLAHSHGGVIKAIQLGKISSTKLRIKTSYKVTRHAIVLVGINQIAKGIEYLDTVSAINISFYGIPIGLLLRVTFTMYLCLGEFISVIETIISVDGENLEPIRDVLVDGRKNIVDRIVDAIVDALVTKIKGRDDKW